MPHIAIHERTLGNGLRVIVCPNTNAPVVTVNVIYHVGSANEQPHKTGLAHLFEHLMFDNTSTGIDKQYDLYCTKAGGTNNAYTTYDHTTYHITLPSHQLEIGLWLEAERMRSFEITEQALATQRSVVLEEINQNVENQPYMKWYESMDSAAYRSDASYSWNVYGSPDHVAGVTMDDARSFFESFYHPHNAVLTIAGDCDVDDAFAKAEEIFGDITSDRLHIERPSFPPNVFNTNVHKVVPDNVPVPAVFVAVHMPQATSDEIYDTDIATSLLGIGKSSVLYKDLVIEQRLASHAGAFVDRKAHGSLLIAYAYAMDDSISPDILCDAIEKSVKGAQFRAEEMKKAMRRQKTAMAMEFQKTHGVADSVGYFATFLNDPSEVNNILTKYEERTLPDVQQVVEKLANRKEWVRIDIVPST